LTILSQAEEVKFWKEFQFSIINVAKNRKLKYLISKDPQLSIASRNGILSQGGGTGNELSWVYSEQRHKKVFLAKKSSKLFFIQEVGSM